MKRRRKIVTEPFDRYRTPPKQNVFMTPVLWLICWLMTRRGRLKIQKVRMKGLKPPFLVLGNHQSFTDFYVTPLALLPYRANYVSELEGFELYGEWLFRRFGCLGTRKFVNDWALVKNIKRVMKRKGVLVLYPEARYANVGTTSRLTPSVGKLAKMLKVPVVAINMRGNYLLSPIWNRQLRRGKYLQSPLWNQAIHREARLEATVIQVYTAEELAGAAPAEINAKLQEALACDEYAWQYERRLAITYKERAAGLEAVLYMCPVCRSEFRTETRGADLFCGQCGSRWHMTVWGQMEPVAGPEPELALKAELEPECVDFSHIPHWYEWEREQVIREIEAGKYGLEMKVHVETLPNAVNFIDLGEGLLTHNEQGFSLTFTDCGGDEGGGNGENKETTLLFAPETMSSIHTEYNYRDKGPCVVLSTVDNTFFLYPRGVGFNVTKIQFATEYLYEKRKKDQKKT